MEDVNITNPRKWYQSWKFPLMPILEIRKKEEPKNEWDSGTSWSFTFKWLFFTCWSLEHFEFEVSLVAGPHWGIGVIGILPYLRWVICIPCPRGVERWIHKNLHR